MTTVMSPISAAVTSTLSPTPAPLSSAARWIHVPEDAISEFTAKVAMNRKEYDVTRKFAAFFGAYFGSNKDGRLWFFNGKYWQVDAKSDTKKKATTLMEDCQSNYSVNFIKDFMELTVNHSENIPEAVTGINARNGFLEFDSFTSSWVLKSHDPKYGQKHVLTFDYDPQATCDLWQTFLDRVQPDPETQAYLQELYGYILLGDARPHAECFGVWLGNGANGKSVAQGVLKQLVGLGNFSSMSLHELDPISLEGLIGKLVNIGSETERSEKLATSILKRWVSKEPLLLKPKYRDPYEFIPKAVPVFAVNDMPPVDDRSDGIWRRMHLLMWLITISSEERDVNLASKLSGELPGILNWALEGARRVLLTGLSVPKAIQDSTLQFRTESNSVTMFLDACTVRQPTAYILKKDLYKAYRQYCKDSGCMALSDVNFGRELKRSVKELSDGKTPKGYVNFDGLKLPNRENSFAGIYIPEGKLQRETLSDGKRVSTVAMIGWADAPQQLALLPEDSPSEAFVLSSQARQPDEDFDRFLSSLI